MPHKTTQQHTTTHTNTQRHTTHNNTTTHKTTQKPQKHTKPLKTTQNNTKQHKTTHKQQQKHTKTHKNTQKHATTHNHTQPHKTTQTHTFNVVGERGHGEGVRCRDKILSPRIEFGTSWRVRHAVLTNLNNRAIPFPITPQYQYHPNPAITPNAMRSEGRLRVA